MSTTATTVAISAAANANAAAANYAAQEAARKACMAFVRGYEHDRATIVEAREYAGCIERLHPEPISDGGMLAIKVIVVALILGAAAGILWGWQKRLGGWIENTLMGAVMGLCVSGGAALLIGGAWFGLRLLLA